MDVRSALGFEGVREPRKLTREQSSAQRRIYENLPRRLLRRIQRPASKTFPDIEGA